MVTGTLYKKLRGSRAGEFKPWIRDEPWETPEREEI